MSMPDREIQPSEQVLVLADQGAAYLRPLNVADVTSVYVDGLNDPEVNRFMGLRVLPPQTIDSVRSYVERHIGATESILFGLFVNARFCGTCRLHNMSSARADLGIALFDRTVWGQGWGSKTVQSVTRYATHDLGCSEVHAGVAAANAASHKIFAKAGYSRAPELDHPWLDDRAYVWVYRNS